MILHCYFFQFSTFPIISMFVLITFMSNMAFYLYTLSLQNDTWMSVGIFQEILTCNPIFSTQSNSLSDFITTFLNSSLISLFLKLYPLFIYRFQLSISANWFSKLYSFQQIFLHKLYHWVSDGPNILNELEFDEFGLLLDSIKATNYQSINHTILL